MGDYRGTVEKAFEVKSNEVEPDPSEGKIDMSSAKFVGLAASYVYMGQPVIPVVNLMLGDTLLVPGVDGKGEMQPNREITREELAVVMMRYAKSCGIAGADAEPSEEGDHRLGRCFQFCDELDQMGACQRRDLGRR